MEPIINELISKAELGDAESQFALGKYYLSQDNKDYQEAYKWMRMAAEQGCTAAQNSVGELFGNGWGVDVNEEEAFKWIEKAAKHGLGRAQYNLGVLYEKGFGIQQGFEKAVEWYIKSAEQGIGRAQYNLAGCYANGNGISQDE